MEAFGIVGMSFGIFGLIAFVNLQQVSKELAELKEQLKAAGVLKEEAGDGDES